MHSAFSLGLGTLLVPTSVGDFLFNQGHGLGNREVHIGSSSNSVKVGSGCCREPVLEALEHKPLVHPMMRTGEYVLLEPLLSFRDEFHPCRLET